MPSRPEGERVECEGNCVRDDGGHSGEVVRVNVTDASNSKDFGGYWYCDNAINEDRRRGFAVTPTPPTGAEQ